MTPEERQLVDGLFARIRANPPGERDPDAERMIRELATRDPNAAYALVQMTLVQEHALRLAEERIRQLEQTAATPPPSSGRSFLSGLMPSAGQRAGSVPSSGTGVWGSGGAGAAAPPPFPGQAAPPPYPGQAAPRGGGFLRSALATAAGVAGGALLFEGISSLFQHNPGPFGGGGGLLGGQAAAATPAAEPAGPWGGGSAHEAAADKPYDKDDGGTDKKDDGWDKGDDKPYADDGDYDPNADAQDYGNDTFDNGSGNDDWSNT
jgi:hypothetical protein